MASVALSTGYLLPIRRLEVRPAAQPTGKRTTFWRWRTIAEAAGSIVFLGLVGWQVCRIGSQLLQLAMQVVAGIISSEPVVNAAQSIGPASGAWPW